MPCRAHGSLLPLVVEGLVVSERVDGLEDLVAEAALVLHADRLVEVANVNAQAADGPVVAAAFWTRKSTKVAAAPSSLRR